MLGSQVRGGMEEILLEQLFLAVICECVGETFSL